MSHIQTSFEPDFHGVDTKKKNLKIGEFHHSRNIPWYVMNEFLELLLHSRLMRIARNFLETMVIKQVESHPDIVWAWFSWGWNNNKKIIWKLVNLTTLEIHCGIRQKFVKTHTYVHCFFASQRPPHCSMRRRRGCSRKMRKLCYLGNLLRGIVNCSGAAWRAQNILFDKSFINIWFFISTWNKN